METYFNFSFMPSYAQLKRFEKVLIKILRISVPASHVYQESLFFLSIP